MISLFDSSRISKVLFLGAHSDDIEIGCGGTILRLIEERPNLNVRWVVFGGNDLRQKEARASGEEFLAKVPSKQIDTHGFRDSYFPSQLDALKEQFEVLKREFSPDIIFTHFREDWHQDHRLVNQLTWNTFRSHVILEYEIVKFDGDLGRPNLFVPLSETIVELKIQLLLRHFYSQQNKQWYDKDTFKAYLRLKGIECNSPTRWAESFHARKLSF